MNSHDTTGNRDPARKRSFTVAGAVVYAVFMATLLCLLWMARRAVLEDSRQTESARAWQEWTHDVREQSRTASPVRRSQPETAEPPAVLLMRDLFPMCIAATILFGSAVFGSFWWLLRGAIFAGSLPSGRDTHPGPADKIP